MPLLHRLLSASTLPKYRAFRNATQTPEVAQAAVWREIRNEMDGGIFWKTKSRALEDFDVTDYEHYRKAIEHGFETSERSPLTGARVLFFAESAGTSNVPKRFPMTKLFRKQFQRTSPPFIHGLLSDFPTLLSHPILYFAAVAPEARSPRGIDIGFISHFNYRTMSPLVRRMYGFPLEVFRDHATFVELGPVYALANDLSAMIAVTPGQLLLFHDQLVERREELAAYVRGDRRPSAGLPTLRFTKKRRELVLRALESSTITFRDLFPSLAVVTTWRSSTCGLQAEVLRPRLGSGVALRDATYSATEGWINVPRGDGVGGAVQPLSHVFEFAEAGMKEPGKKDLLSLHELEAGRDYEIFLTTAMGMVRYRLYDVVRCSGHLARTPIVAFHQKAASQISLGLVQISEAELVQAMAEASFEPSGRFVFGPNGEGDGLIFFYEGTEGEALASRLERVHQRLGIINQYYGAYSKKTLVRALGARSLPNGHPAFGAQRHAQTKPKVLRNEPVAV